MFDDINKPVIVRTWMPVSDFGTLKAVDGDNVSAAP